MEARFDSAAARIEFGYLRRSGERVDSEDSRELTRPREGEASVIEICVTSPFPIYGNHNVVYLGNCAGVVA